MNLHEKFIFQSNYLKVDLWQMLKSEKNLVLGMLHHIFFDNILTVYDILLVSFAVTVTTVCNEEPSTGDLENKGLHLQVL